MLPASAPMSRSMVVPLVRTAAKLSTAGEANFYLGEIPVGPPPQSLKVVFDTASGHVLLPHRACRNVTCLEHRRYSPWESSTAMDVDIAGKAVQAGRRIARGNGTRDGVTLDFSQSDLGEGQVQAVLVRDSVCLGSQTCVDMAVLAAYTMDDKPFRHMPSDGII